MIENNPSNVSWPFETPLGKIGTSNGLILARQ
jgi:hypothetical protein